MLKISLSFEITQLGLKSHSVLSAYLSEDKSSLSTHSSVQCLVMSELYKYVHGDVVDVDYLLEIQ